MPGCEVLPFEDHADARDELVPFLHGVFRSGPDAARWRARLAHWWDENPAAKIDDRRGWVLRHGGRLAGFLGVIPVRYTVGSNLLTAFWATSWFIESEHRNAALPMLMKYQRLASTHLLVDTTPSAEVRVLLERTGWTPETIATRRYLFCGTLGRLAGVSCGGWPSLPAGSRVITDTRLVRSIARPWQREDRLEKHITPEHLRWYETSVMRRHLFAGIVDGEGQLSTYAWFTPRATYARPAVRLSLIEGFSASENAQEWQALLGCIVRGDVTWPGVRQRFITWESFDSEHLPRGLPWLPAGRVSVCHYHKKPASMAGTLKHSVIAEGDFGL